VTHTGRHSDTHTPPSPPPHLPCPCAAKGLFAGLGASWPPPLPALRRGRGGFLKGAAVGVAGVVVLPTIGIVQGARQVGSGIKNTPEKVSACSVLYCAVL